MNILRVKQNTKVTESGCWEWTRSTNSDGYGQLTENGRYWLTHRYAFACENRLESYDIVRHKCHNRKCCNPEHLIKGTHKDNYEDSKYVHTLSDVGRRKKWSVAGVSYGTCKEVVAKTGISMSSVIKFTEDGVFNVDKYRQACRLAGWAPKL